MRNDSGAENTRFAPRLLASVLGHVAVVMAFFFAPTSAPPALPVAVTVNLVAAVPRSAPAPAPAAVPKPAPPPKPVQKKVVLPKQAPVVKPKPKAKVQPKPVKRPARIERPRREKVEQVEYDDALDLLRQELGEDRPAEASESTNEPQPDAVPSKGTMRVSPEWMAWQSEARRRVRSNWVTPTEFLERNLTTTVSVELGADGTVIGTPTVTIPSGDPFWDDNTVRAILAASPLPAPPTPGPSTFQFSPGERF